MAASALEALANMTADERLEAMAKIAKKSSRAGGQALEILADIEGYDSTVLIGEIGAAYAGLAARSLEILETRHDDKPAEDVYGIAK